MGDSVTCLVRVIDVNGDAIPAASVVLGASTSLPLQRVTDIKGEALFIIASREPNTALSISHFDYVREKVTFNDDLVAGPYNNPLLERSAGSSPDSVVFTVRLGRWSCAPIRLLGYDELLALSKEKKDLKACVVEEIDGGQLSYRDTYAYPLSYEGIREHARHI